MKLLFLILRVASYYIDLIVYGAFLYLFGSFSFYSIIIALIGLFIYRVTTLYFLGSTIGMKLLGLRLSSRCFNSVVKRELYRIASTPYNIGYFFALLGDNSQCLHDYMAKVKVIYIPRSERISKKKPIFSSCIGKEPLRTSMIYITVFLTVFSLGSFTTKFLMNHVGMIGFTLVSSSNEYKKDLDSTTNLVKSQEGLFKSTIAMTVTEVITIGGDPSLIRLSPKDGSTEVYRLDSIGSDLIGSLLYTLPYSAEYIDAFDINSKRLLTYLTKDNLLHIIDENGNVLHEAKSSLTTPIDLKVGLVNGIQSIVIISSEGYAEVFRPSHGKLDLSYTGKIGDDIIPQQFLLDDDVYILKDSGSEFVYKYSFTDKFNYLSNIPINISSASTFNMINLKDKEYFLFSDVNRANMMFSAGDIQVSKVLSKNGDIIYDLGERKGSIYKYRVNQVDNVFDLDGDGEDEIIIKSFTKGDVEGNSYSISIYKPNDLLWLNKVLTKLLRVFSLPI